MTFTLRRFATQLNMLAKNYKAKGMADTVKDLNRAGQLVRRAANRMKKSGNDEENGDA